MAAIRFENWEAVEKFETLVNPKIKIPKAVSSKNNVYDDMVQNSPYIEEVIKSFSDFIKGYCIVGQNLKEASQKWLALFSRHTLKWIITKAA